MAPFLEIPETQLKTACNPIFNTDQKKRNTQEKSSSANITRQGENE
jgi:hypothetical protein